MKAFKKCGLSILIIFSQLFSTATTAQIVISPGGVGGGIGGFSPGGFDGEQFNEQFNLNPSLQFGMVDTGASLGQIHLTLTLISLMSGGQIDIQMNSESEPFGADKKEKDDEDSKDVSDEAGANETYVKKSDTYGFAYNDGQPVPPVAGQPFDSFVYEDGRGVVVGPGVWTDRFSDNGNPIAKMDSGQFYPASTLSHPGQDVGSNSSGPGPGDFKMPDMGFQLPKIPNLTAVGTRGLSRDVPLTTAVNGLCLGFNSNLNSTIETVGDVFKAADLMSRAGFGDEQAKSELKSKAQKALDTTHRILNAGSVLLGPTIFDPSSHYDAQRAEQLKAWNRLSDSVKTFVQRQWQDFQSKSPEEQTELIGKATGWLLAEIATGAIVMRTAEEISKASKIAENIAEDAKLAERAGESAFGESKVGPEYNHYIEKGPLSDEVASTFGGKNYTSIKPSQDEVFYRWGDGNGSYWSRTPPTSQMQAMSDSAILPDWNDFSEVTEVRIPKGADWEFFEGKAGSQSGNLSKNALPERPGDVDVWARRNQTDTGRASGYFSGGGNQVYIERKFLNEKTFQDSVKTYTIDQWKRLNPK